ncbi:MAG: asparagine synthase (glutamine-hydrolyzing), partial [Halobacteriales archaeon]|nr:asparagine synthase (glutamine-hydrolyzing) [Halobacteriales archaeon]
MCGFVGLISSREIDDGSRRAVERAAESILHRGPDSNGLLATPFAHIAFRRLSVVDLANGRQPLGNEDGTVQVFLNGEIFNHKELRRALTRRGHVLQTRSDTEVLPHLWEERGPQMLSELNGMFALCVVDSSRNEVFVARDRLGIKPMFIAKTSRGTVFGSELKAVLATGLVPRDFAREVAVRFIDTLSAGGRSTLIRGVSRLLPGEALHVTPEGERTLRWYDLAAELRTQPGTSSEEEVLELLLDSVDLRLHADVPVGISLSGGVDSTMLALLAREAGHEHVAAFTADFEEAPREEIESARAVADALGLRHEVCSATTADFVR